MEYGLPCLQLDYEYYEYHKHVSPEPKPVCQAMKSDRVQSSLTFEHSI